MGCLVAGAILILASFINARLPVSIQGPKQLDDQIAIIGGGISAIDMADRLIKRGYRNVHILVKEQRLGGDEVCSRVHRGTVHELGKHMFVPASEALELDAKALKYVQGSLTEIKLPTVWKSGNINTPLQTYIEERGQSNFPRMNSDQLKVALLDHIRALNRSVTTFFQQRNTEVPDELSWQEKFQYTGSFKDLLIRMGLLPLEPLLTYLFSSMGYGRLEEIPAHYGIFFFKPKVLNNLHNRIQDNNGIDGITSFKIASKGMENLLDSWSQFERMNISFNVRIDEIVSYTNRYKIYMDVNGVQKAGVYDFIIFSEDLKDYVALNKYRTHDQYQMFLRPAAKYLIKTLVDSVGVRRGVTPFEFYPESFLSPDAWREYRLANGIDSYAAQNDNSGLLYQQNRLDNSNEQRNPNDPLDNEKRMRKSAVYTQMSRGVPNVADANNVLSSYLRSMGATQVNIIETKVWKFFPHYEHRDMTNGIIYSIMNLQGKHGMWFIGRSAFLDHMLPMLEYNKMLMRKFI